MSAVFVYLMLLPWVVWLLGSVFSLLDHEDYSATFRRIAWRIVPLLVVALVLGSSAARPMGAAFATVLGLQFVWFYAVRLVIRRGWLAESGEQ
jgi:hypothetical protein